MALNPKNNDVAAAAAFVVDEEAAGQKAAAGGGGGGGGGGGIVQARRKGLGVRAWLVVLESGQTRVEEVGKHSIMRRTGLPARDLRALDPALSYPSSILGRERAIVVNLEHIKAIITAKEVLILNSSNPLVVHFVLDLQHRIDNDFHHNNTTAAAAAAAVPPPHPSPPPQEGMEHYNGKMEIVENAAEVASRGGGGKPPVEMGGVGGAETRNDESLNEEAAAPGAMDVVTTGRKVPPFEFRALEACLESACRCLESETQTLEKEAYPALDELTSQVSTLNLERVRQIKSRLVAISGRVQKVRDELEHLLDDDNDMAEMYLTEKLAARLADHTSSKEQAYRENLESDDERDYDCKSEENSETYTTFKPDIEELEMLLEAYFAQIDGILQKLYHMREYVDDTEDFINIMLDDKQNQLLEMGVMLSTANMIINAGIVVVGLFGMNISITLFDGKPIQFWSTVMGTCGGCVALYVVALAWGKKKKLLAL